MKKMILIALAMCFAGAGIAQVAQYKPKAWYKNVKQINRVMNDEPGSPYAVELNPTVSNSRAADVVIGDSWYDNQSNAAIGTRIFTFDDGTMGATWIRGMTPTAYADRGTGYNYFDGTSWGAIPTERVEEVRTGWPSYAPYGINGEIICAHTGGNAGLQFSWRENKGEGDWNYFTLAGPAAQPDLTWPKMMTSGENNEVIHVIACAGAAVAYEGLTNALLYSRSMDGGLTWDPENVVLDGMGSDYTSGWGGDSYSFAHPVGNTLAFVAFGGIKDGIVMKSTDGGDNWERILFYESPDPYFDGNGGNLPQCGGGDGYNDIVIDDQGMVHVAFGRQIHLDDTPDDDTWSYYPYSDGLVYWKEGMPILDTAMIQSDIYPEDWTTMNLYQSGMLAAWTQPHGNDTLIGVATYQASLTSMPQLVITRDAFGTQIVQLFYSAVSVGFDNSEFNFRHIWGRFTEGDGRFSPYTDYTGDVFHIFSECVYPSVAQTMPDNKFHMLYQTDNMPGNSIIPTPPSHDPVLNNMVYLEISPLPVNVTDNVAQSLEISQNFPNPFNGKTYVEVTLNEASNVSMEVYTLTGQKVAMSDYGYKTTGSHTIAIDASPLNTGVYFYTITAGESKVTRKMMVE
ncbi:MAG: hypothetical protein COW63_11870 [Bacteroidetes bacterium CG18_big_fil_WC_8_21_14_2_50_41_14]|nr:MAG: hypothetical protein COW63_11870 [Bacteroidetes bacterium CG18_big_fil_WC_8_21_14_2_50_41_14]